MFLLILNTCRKKRVYYFQPQHEDESTACERFTGQTIFFPPHSFTLSHKPVARTYTIVKAQRGVERTNPYIK